MMVRYKYKIKSDNIQPDSTCKFGLFFVFSGVTKNPFAFPTDKIPVRYINIFEFEIVFIKVSG